MTSISNDRKKRGRPKVGATHIGVRVPPDLLQGIDQWIAEDGAMLGDPDMSRPEAIRRLTTEALTSLGVIKPK